MAKHTTKKKSTHTAHATHEAEPKHATKAAPQKANSNDMLKNVAIVVLLIALMGVVWVFVIKEDNVGSSSVTSGTPVASAGDFGVSPEIQQQMKTLADDDPYIGADDAAVTIVEFSDFQCPYCARFRTDTFDKIKANFIDTGVVKFVYRDLALSFHANAEKAAEASQCAHDQGKFWEYHDKLFANQGSLDVNSLKAYAVSLGLNAAEFNSCLDTGKYTSEVREDAADAGRNGLSGTPAFIINGKTLSGAQPYEKFEQAICAAVPESEPCKNIEPPKKFQITVLSDTKCTTCNVAQMKGVLSDLFPGASYKDVDAASAEGKKLIADYDLVYAPSYLFPEDVADTSAWKSNSQLAPAFKKISTGYQLRDEATGASWFYSAEKQAEVRAQKAQMLGLELNDNKPQVDFFVMSYCPYGNQAEELLKPVFDELKGSATFVPRYVIYSQGTGCYTDTDGTQLCSLHGNVELNQNIRELCVYNNYGEQEWFDFALAMNSQCNQNNADTCWTGVASGLGLDTDMIETCFDENKLSYAREQYELNALLGVRGSPTLFFEGDEYNGARSANGYLGALCAGFENKPAACNNVVVETVAAPASGSC